MDATESTANTENTMSASIIHVDFAARKVISNTAIAPAIQPAPKAPTHRDKFRGGNYEATADLDIADVAKLVRKDIAAARKSGLLPKGLKISVTIDRYSMGQSLSAMIKAAPFQIHTDAFRAWCEADARDYDNIPAKYSTETEDAIEVLRNIVKSYNRDNSDSMTDYYDVRFAEHVGVHWQVSRSE